MANVRFWSIYQSKDFFTSDPIDETARALPLPPSQTRARKGSKGEMTNHVTHSRPFRDRLMRDCASSP